MKKCVKCKKLISKINFNNDKNSKDKLQNYCKPCHSIASKKWYEKVKKNPEKYEKLKVKQVEFARKRRKENLEHIKNIQKKYIRKLKIETLNAYSNGKIECVCCNEKMIEFLNIDHIFNDGKEERDKMLNKNFYVFLKRKGYPNKERYQILCYNCNFTKQAYGICPHKRSSN